VCGGHDKTSERDFAGVRMHCVDHNSYDHTALVDIVECEPEGTWWFAMHGTSRVGPRFLRSIMKFGFKHDHVSVLKNGWLNMGLFSRRFLVANAQYIMNLKNCNKMMAILSEQLYPRLCSSCAHYDTVPSMHILQKDNAYGDGIERQCLYFKPIDLYKYQSFHYASEATRRIKTQYHMPTKNLSEENMMRPQQVSVT